MPQSTTTGDDMIDVVNPELNNDQKPTDHVDQDSLAQLGDLLDDLNDPEKIDKLLAQLTQLKAQKEEIKFQERLQEIDNLVIKLNIHNVTNIIQLAGYLKRRKSAANNIGKEKPKQKPRPSKTRWVDPSNPENIWVGRGQPKGWLREKIIALGFDPKDPKVIQDFCRKNLERQQINEDTGVFEPINQEQ